MVTYTGCKGEDRACTVTYTNGPRRANRAVGTSCGSNSVLIDRKSNMDRVVRRVVGERVRRTWSLIETIHRSEVRRVGNNGRKGEDLACTVTNTDGPRGADRA